MRITRKDLLRAIERLNAMSKRTYLLEGAYGGWQLAVLIDANNGSIDNVTYGFIPARELYDIIHAIIKYIEQENKHLDKLVKV